MSPTSPSPNAHASAHANANAAPLRARWQALAPREQHLLRAAAVLVAAALLWWLALGPALATLRSAPARHASLDAQLQQMQALQTQAQQLQDAPRADPDAALRALQTSVTEHLGTSARLAVAGDRATLTLQGAPAGALATWLVQARSNAKSVPQEAHLVRSATAPAARATAPSAPPRARWDGQLVLALPPR